MTCCHYCVTLNSLFRHTSQSKREVDVAVEKQKESTEVAALRASVASGVTQDVPAPDMTPGIK